MRGGAPLHIEDIPGDAPPVVLLHHGAGSLRAWDRFVPGIAGGRRILAYDRRGFGLSPRDAIFDAGLFARDADDLAELLRMRAAAPAHLIGHSDGATVALLTAVRHPESVLSATAISGHVRRDREVVDALLRAGPPEASPRHTLDEYRERHGHDWQEVVDAWWCLWTGGALAGWDIEPELARIRCPVLVVHDRRDALSRPEHGEAVERRAPRALVSWYETGSHAPHRADPARFQRELAAHLRDSESGGA